MSAQRAGSRVDRSHQAHKSRLQCGFTHTLVDSAFLGFGVKNGQKVASTSVPWAVVCVLTQSIVLSAVLLQTGPSWVREARWDLLKGELVTCAHAPAAAQSRSLKWKVLYSGGCVALKKQIGGGGIGGILHQLAQWLLGVVLWLNLVLRHVMGSNPTKVDFW